MAAEPARIIALALDPSVEPPDDALSERILDASLALSAAFGLRNLTIDDVARRARVGRMTVYRRFGSKGRLVEALAIRESRRCIAELDAAMRPDAPFEEQIADAFVTSMRLAREHPLLNRLARLEPESVLESLAGEQSGIFAAARAFTASRLTAAIEAGVLVPVEVEETAELLVRLGVSFVLIQDTVFPVEDDARARAAARRLMAPLLTGLRPR
jgi:AcrR family transcriptional regulator